MKTVFIVRHAKSSWDKPGLNDHERPLLQKGINRTKLISDYLSRQNMLPDIIFSSTAIRAYETSKLIADAIGCPAGNIRTDRRLYLEGGTAHIFAVISEVSQNIDSIMIVGHNPTLTLFVNEFLDNEIDWLPTSGLVSISFETDDWKKIELSKPTTNFVISPKSLKEPTD